MKVIEKVQITAKALKKANKIKIIKKVYNVLKIGGIQALKESIVQTARRDELIRTMNTNINEKNIYVEQQALQNEYENICAGKVTIFVYIPDSEYFVKDTLDSIKRQAYYNYEIILLMPSKVMRHFVLKNDDSIKTYSIDKDLSIKDLLASIEGSYFMFLQAGNCLSPNALYCFVNEMEKGYGVAYSDECIWNFENGSIVKQIIQHKNPTKDSNKNLDTAQSVCFNKKYISQIEGVQWNYVHIADVIDEYVINFLNSGIQVTHINKILLLRHYHFELKFVRRWSAKIISDTFDSSNRYKLSNIEGKRNVLLISHELTLTGAPIALHYAAKALLENGDNPVVISPYDGNLRQTILEDGIAVIVDSNVFSNDKWIDFAKKFDLVLVCTLAGYRTINYLEEANIATLWWAHEAIESYENGNLKNTLPENIKDNIHVYCGGEYARKILRLYRPKYTSDLLLYAVPDFSKSKSMVEYKIDNINNKVVFTIVGTIMKRKGQDILAKAVLQMPANIVSKCKFIFVGKMFDSEIYVKVKELKNKYPNEVILIDEVSRDVLMEIYKQCDCIICASRDDPMPIFMTEGMMLSKILICSDNTGTASLLKDGENGFVYCNDDYQELKEKILYVIEHIDKLEAMKKKSRETYENNFSMEMFSKKLISTIDSLIIK